MINPETDILIIGGGIAGCIAAISLADTHSVVLIDKLKEPNERIGESLAPAAQRILKELGLLEGMEQGASSEERLYLKNIGMQSFWGSERVHIVDHLINPDGFVQSLNRKAFESYLRTSAIKKGVKCIWPAKLYNSNYEANCWNIAAKSDGQNNNQETYHIKAKFVIDATGRQAHFAKSLNVKRQSIDKLIACWGTMPNSLENRMSTISASENGWWYSAVIPGNKRIMAFQTDADLIDKKRIKEVDFFIALTKENKEMARILEETKSDLNFHGTVAANSTRLEQVAGQKWVALGDAAISFDPLSSQGMYNAMANAMQLTKLLLELNLIHEFNSEKEKDFQRIYTQQIDKVWNYYLQHKKMFYSTEMRWNTSPFWKRRH